MRKVLYGCSILKTGGHVKEGILILDFLLQLNGVNGKTILVFVITFNNAIKIALLVVALLRVHETVDYRWRGL